jgi:hypothetical protein
MSKRGRPRKHKDNAARQRAYRLRKYRSQIRYGNGSPVFQEDGSLRSAEEPSPDIIFPNIELVIKQLGEEFHRERQKKKKCR